MPDEACYSCMPNSLQSHFQKYKSYALLQLYVLCKLCAICAISLRSYFYYDNVHCLCHKTRFIFLHVIIELEKENTGNLKFSWKMG